MSYRVGDTLRYEFEVEKVLFGGMGEVYVVRHKKNLLQYAAKTFKKEFFTNSELMDKFTREARIWIGLGRHPNIVQAFNVFHVDDRPFVFLEYVAGGNLENLLDCQPVELDQALAIAAQICDGMIYVHESAGLVHCDLKPLNIMLGTRGIIKVTDFGLAALVQDRRDGVAEKGAGYGTLPYMAPEQFVPRGPVRFTTDIYAVGVTLFRLMTGCVPFIGPTKQDFYRQHTSADPPQIRQLNPLVPHQLDEIVLRCLEKNPKKRYQHFRDLREDLDRILDCEATALHKVARLAADEQWFVIEKGKLISATEDIKRFSEVYNKAVSEFELGDYETSVNLFQKALGIRPGAADAWNGKANSLRKLDRHKEAEECYLRAVTLDPLMPEGWANLGRLFYDTDRYDDALGALDKALEASPDVPPFWAIKADILLKLDRRSEAWDSLNTALDLNPRCTEALFLRGQMLQQDGSIDEAIVCLSRILEIAPRHVRALSLVSLLLMKKHSYSEALRHLEILLQMPGDDMEACLESLAVCHMNLADFKQALAFFRRLKEADPSNADYCYNVGLCLHMLGHEDQARAHYEEAIDRRPDHFKACNNLGAWHFEKGNGLKAMEWFEKALSIDPENEAVRERIKFVKEQLL